MSNTDAKTFDWSQFKIPLVMLAIFWVIALVLWQATGRIFYLLNFGYIGLSLCLGLGVYAGLPRRKKLWGRRLAQFLIGVYMLLFLGLLQRENMQLEGFFFYLLSGFFAGSVIHYLIAKVGGPLIFNRGWCGWACWTAMILDLLPYRRNKGLPFSPRWGLLRYLHFALSLTLVLGLWWGVSYRVQAESQTELAWLVGGNLLYYGIGIPLAFLLKDNRAFCKYICPIPPLQKVGSAHALLKISGDGEKCNECSACVKLCLMDIRIPDYILKGERVHSSECILCLECINACPKGVLTVSFALDKRPPIS